jgi:hypothetical protein
MPFTKFTSLDFDQIKTSIRDYLRANSNFTDFDFEGSNFSVLIDTLAYNTYITAFNTNMVANEAFLDSATIRENVVSLARNIGYVPRSRTSARAQVYFSIPTSSVSPTLTLQAGLICVGNTNDSSFIFSIPESITTTIVNGVANFGTASDPINVYQGTFLKKEFVVNGSLDQRFILDNSFIDTSTIVVKVKGISDGGEGKEYTLIDNILNVKATSETYLIQEIKDEKYELLFGDGIFGKKLENGSIITASYIVTDGQDGNGPGLFDYAGTIRGSVGELIIPTGPVTINTVRNAQGGGEIESIDSVKYFAPRLYSSQYRAVTGRDYESIIQTIYPNTESVSVVGGEELTPPQYGKVLISIKPKNGDFVSDFDKQFILNKLGDYSLVGIKQEIIDLKILYVEIDSYVYYNSSQVTNIENLKSTVFNVVNSYANSVDLNKFGGRFKYSKLLQLIDNSDVAITSNITKVIIRRNLNAQINRFAQYELCFGNQFHINPNGLNIKSTGFTIFGENNTCYMTDIPNTNGDGKGIISVVTLDEGSTRYRVVNNRAGTVDYTTGEIFLGPIQITSTILPNNIIQIQAYPESNDVVGLKDLYLSLDVSSSKINMVRDTISSGEQISGVGFKVTSSYSNGELTRK